MSGHQYRGRVIFIDRDGDRAGDRDGDRDRDRDRDRDTVAPQ